MLVVVCNLARLPRWASLLQAYARRSQTTFSTLPSPSRWAWR